MRLEPTTSAWQAVRECPPGLCVPRDVGALHRPDISLVWIGGGIEPYHDVAFDHGADRRLAAGATRVYRPDRQDVGGATRRPPTVAGEKPEVREGTVEAAP